MASAAARAPAGSSASQYPGCNSKFCFAAGAKWCNKFAPLGAVIDSYDAFLSGARRCIGTAHRAILLWRNRREHETLQF